MLTTLTKLKLARAAYRIVSRARRMVGRSDITVVKRGGALFELDLGEGIDFAIYLLGAFERSTQQTLQQLVRPDHVVFDVGANIGAHTLAIARAVGPAGRVFAFEPTEFAYQKLCRNVSLNPGLQSRVHARQVMFAAHRSDQLEEEIYARWPLLPKRAVHPKHQGQMVSTLGAAVDTIDSFFEREQLLRLDLVKLDVDGHELPVLEGARDTLRRLRPVLVLELCPYIHAEFGHRFSNLIDLLSESRYRLFDASGSRSLPLDARALSALIPTRGSINAVAQPL